MKKDIVQEIKDKGNILEVLAPFLEKSRFELVNYALSFLGHKAKSERKLVLSITAFLLEDSESIDADWYETQNILKWNLSEAFAQAELLLDIWVHVKNREIREGKIKQYGG